MRIITGLLASLIVHLLDAPDWAMFLAYLSAQNNWMIYFGGRKPHDPATRA